MIGIALRYAGIWLLLLLLLGATAATAFIQLKGTGAILHLGVAGLQVVLVWLLFMDLRRSSGVVRLCAVTGLLWLSFMFALAFSDYFTRGWNDASTRYPQNTATW